MAETVPTAVRSHVRRGTVSLVGDDDPIVLSDSLQAVVRSLRPSEPDRAVATPAAVAGVFGGWDEAVGQVVAGHARPVKLDGTRLTVEVDDPAWATQFQFFADTVRVRLREVAGVVVEDIDVRVARA